LIVQREWQIGLKNNRSMIGVSIMRFFLTCDGFFAVLAFAMDNLRLQTF